MNTNTQKREAIFQFLFHLELAVNNAHRKELILKDEVSIKEYWEEFKPGLEYELTKKQESELLETVLSTLREHHDLEDIIETYASKWKNDRISRVNYTILLMSIHELTFEKHTPYKVVINEAIELSKKFGDKDSKDFINGLLDKYYKEEIL